MLYLSIIRVLGEPNLFFYSPRRRKGGVSWKRSWGQPPTPASNSASSVARTSWPWIKEVVASLINRYSWAASLENCLELSDAAVSVAAGNSDPYIRVMQGEEQLFRSVFTAARASSPLFRLYLQRPGYFSQLFKLVFLTVPAKFTADQTSIHSCSASVLSCSG